MVRKYLKVGVGLGAGVFTILILFQVLVSLYGFQINDLTGNFVCEGSFENPCISDFTVRNPNPYHVDIYSKDQVKLDFSPEIQDYALFVKDGRCSATGKCACELKDGSKIGFKGWRCTDFTNKTKPLKNRVYNFRFPAYTTKSFRLAGIKLSPFDDVKWGFGTGKGYLDPTWYSIITFNNSLSNENLTFTGDQNITRYLSIERNANVTSAYLNLSGYYNINTLEDDTEDSYSCTNEGNLTPPYNSSNAVDENWSSYAQSILLGAPGSFVGNDTWIYENFTIPSDVNSSNWTAKVYVEGGCESDAVEISVRCWDYNTNSWSSSFLINWDNSEYNGTIQTNTSSTAAGIPASNCLSGSILQIKTEIVVEQESGGIKAEARYYEGKAIWIYHNYTNNPWLEVGTPDGTKEWNYTGKFNSTHSPNKTDDISSIINNALNSGLCDCAGCSITNGNCSVPFLFHSDTAGKLQYDDINITYNLLLETNLVSPVDTYNSTNSSNYFVCNATSGVISINITNVTLYGNWSSGWHSNYTNDTSSFNINETTLNISRTIADGTYVWNCLAYDTNNNSEWADSNYTLTIDATNPLISYNPTTTAEGNYANSTQNWIFVNITCSDTNRDSVVFNWNGTNETFDNSAGNFYWENKSGLEVSHYTFFAWCNDSFNNSNQTVTRTVTIMEGFEINVTLSSGILDIVFNATNMTGTFEPINQTNTKGVLTADNNHSSVLDVGIIFNETFSNITVYANSIYNFSNATSINASSYAMIIKDLAVDATNYIWMWAVYNDTRRMWWPQMEVIGLK